MIHQSSKKPTWANDDEPVIHNLQESAAGNGSRPAEDSNADPQHTQRKKMKLEVPGRPENASRSNHAIPEEAKPETGLSGAAEIRNVQDMEDESSIAAQAPNEPVSDSDWLRSKTSRLLGLLDEDEQAELNHSIPAETETVVAGRPATTSTPVSADADDADAGASTETVVSQQPKHDENIDLIRKSARLFVRNLPYDATEGDIEPIFIPFGRIEEVCA